MAALLVRRPDRLRVAFTGPYDAELAAANRAGPAPVDAAPDSPAISAVATLVATLEEVIANAGRPGHAVGAT